MLYNVSVIAWEIEVTEEFENWYLNLDQATRRRVIATVDLLEERGPALTRPYADTLEGSRHSNMKELRPTPTVRILFAFDPERTAMLLIGGNKRDQWTEWYEEAIPMADDLYDEHLKSLKRRK